MHFLTSLLWLTKHLKLLTEYRLGLKELTHRKTFSLQSMGSQSRSPQSPTLPVALHSSSFYGGWKDMASDGVYLQTSTPRSTSESTTKLILISRNCLIMMIVVSTLLQFRVLWTVWIQVLSFLDYGCGPALYPLISAAPHVSEITLADYPEANRKYVKENCSDSRSGDWEKFFEYVVRNLERREEVDAVTKRVELVRKAVVCTLWNKLMIYQSNPFSNSINF